MLWPVITLAAGVLLVIAGGYAGVRFGARFAESDDPVPEDVLEQEPRLHLAGLVLVGIIVFGLGAVWLVISALVAVFT